VRATSSHAACQPSGRQQHLAGSPTPWRIRGWHAAADWPLRSALGPSRCCDLRACDSERSGYVQAAPLLAGQRYSRSHAKWARPDPTCPSGTNEGPTPHVGLRIRDLISCHELRVIKVPSIRATWIASRPRAHAHARERYFMRLMNDRSDQESVIHQRRAYCSL
jgi:hypothetical protein